MTFQSHSTKKAPAIVLWDQTADAQLQGNAGQPPMASASDSFPGVTFLVLPIFCYSGSCGLIPAGFDVYSVFFQLLNRMWFPLNNSIIEKIYPEPTMVRDWLTERIQAEVRAITKNSSGNKLKI